MSGLIETLLSSGSFIPHGHCYLWQTPLVWLHILSDSIIALAYYSIPITLVYFVQKRKDLPFDWVFLLFSAFIVSCGTTHLMEIWTLWHPTYWLSGALKAITSLVSLYTAISLVQLVPQALTIPSPAQLSAVNLELKQQIRDREQAEDQVRQLNQKLEQKVAQRTAELESSMVQVQDYAEQMTLAMDAAKMGSWDWDLKTQKVTWNPNHEILWGYSPGTAERSYEDWKRPIHPDDLARAEAALQHSMATNADFSEEYRVIWKNGTVRWAASFGRFYFNEHGKPFRMLGMVQDITERKKSEAALKESERKFSVIFNQTYEFIGLISLDGILLEVNQSALDSIAAQKDDIVDKKFWETPWWNHSQALQEQLKAAIDRAVQGEFVCYEVAFPDGNGETMITNFSLKPVLNEENQVEMLVAEGYNITERKQAEAALLDSEERFRNLADNISQLAWMTAADGGIVWYNRRWFEYTGTTFAQMEGWGWQHVHHPDHVERVVERFRHCIETGERWEDTFPLQGKDGKFRWFLSRAIPITNAEGQILRWFGTNTDITDLQSVQAQLEERNSELDNFVHIVSHDLKAPLRAISNLSEWIEEDLEGSLSPDTQNQMSLLRNRVYRMEAMINGLLNYARVGRTDSQIEQVSVAELLIEVIDSIAPPPTFVITFAPNLPIFRAKSLILFQVFANLIGNGIKHHNRVDGSIDISVEDRGDFYEFAVADDGPGIAVEHQANIFKIFQTGNHNNNLDSTGVGLAIVKKIVEAETGAIRLESELDKGTTFYFTWPKESPIGT